MDCYYMDDSALCNRVAFDIWESNLYYDSYFDTLSHIFDSHPRLISINNIKLQK